MPYSIPNTASTDSYQTWGNGIYTGGWLQVFDQTGVTGGGGVYAYVSHRPSGSSGPTADAEAVQLTPGWYPLIGTPRDPIVSVTFKSAIAGKPAQVYGLLVEDGAAGFGSGTQISGSLSSTGTTTPGTGGGGVTVFDYTTRSTLLTINNVAKAAAVAVITSASYTFDGTTACQVVFSCPYFQRNAGVAGGFNLYIDGTDQGSMAEFQNATAVTLIDSLLLISPRFTPTSGAHTISVRGWNTVAANVNVGTSAGDLNSYQIVQSA